MARAETIEHVGETGGGGGNSPLPRHGNCHMELHSNSSPFNSWLTTTITPQPPQQPVRVLPCPHMQPSLGHPEGQARQSSSSTTPPPPPPPSPPPPCNQRREGRRRGQPGGAQSAADSDREELQEASRRQGPLPDLLPQNEHHSWASHHHHHHHQHGAASVEGEGEGEEEEEQELEVRRLADQLRVIGDEFNTTVLRRTHAGPHWQDIWRGLLNFIDHTLSTLYRLT